MKQKLNAKYAPAKIRLRFYRSHPGDLCLGIIFFVIYDTHCFCSSGDGARTNNSLAVSISAVTVKKNDLMRK